MLELVANNGNLEYNSEYGLNTKKKEDKQRWNTGIFTL